MFFAGFLAMAGVFNRWGQGCPLRCSRPNASRPLDVFGALMASVRQALDRPWVLDMDATIKPLYGRQEGAAIGYKPHNPGRPSHVLLTFWVGNLRLVLDAVLRRRIKHDIALTAKGASKKRGQHEANGQLTLALPHDEVQDNAQVWKYTVLATNATYGIEAIGQLYCDRCESGCDELKNQWGWGGFTTQDIHRSQVTARAVALVYNWWSWYVRAANP